MAMLNISINYDSIYEPLVFITINIQYMFDQLQLLTILYYTVLYSILYSICHCILESSLQGFFAEYQPI